jgi:hypothetical protein
MQTDVRTSEPAAWLRPLALFVAAAGVFASIALARGLFDPDYFWHLATGRLILEGGAVPVTDPFSFTWHGEPWIADQWLADVVIAAGVASVGPGVVIVAFAFVAAIGPAAIAAAALRSGVGLLRVAVMAAIVTTAMLPQVTIRPQVISFAMTGLVLALLVRARPETARRLWLIPGIFLVWANVHGFFIVGLGVGLVYLLATLLGRTPMRTHRRLVLAVAAASLVATMLTPSGPSGLAYALSFADPGDLGARQIVEWQSPNFHNPQFLGFLAVLGLLFLTGMRRAPGWVAVVALAGAALGLFAVRSIGVGSLLILPLLLLSAEARVVAPRTRTGRPHQLLELAAAIAMCVILTGVDAFSGPVTVDPRRAPIAATEVLRAEDPDARVLAAYEWGGYVINELYPRGGTVFVDGRMHKYQPEVIADYLAIVDAEPGWETLVDEYDVEALLLYPSMLLAKGPAADAGWCEAYRDELQVLMLRTCEGP